MRTKTRWASMVGITASPAWRVPMGRKHFHPRNPHCATLLIRSTDTLIEQMSTVASSYRVSELLQFKDHDFFMSGKDRHPLAKDLQLISGQLRRCPIYPCPPFSHCLPNANSATCPDASHLLLLLKQFPFSSTEQLNRWLY